MSPTNDQHNNNGKPKRTDKARGFMVYGRALPKNEDPKSRLQHWKEFTGRGDDGFLKEQGYRCMNCGVPFCMSGCPLGNIIPDFNDLVKDQHWKDALERLHSTNNFPEFTGRVCPAPCESSCVLGINEPPVTIKLIERTITDRGYENDWIQPEPPKTLTGKKIAIVGSGPAGLAAAQQLRRAGHEVTVYERDDEPGGLLLYGIPDFKMEKHHVRRRIEQMTAEGVTFVCNTEVGKDIAAKQLVDENDAVLLAVGSTVANDFVKSAPGRDLAGIEYAMDFLPQQNRRVSGKEVAEQDILANDKHVVILGGGDTGSDCLGTSLRQGAKSVTTYEITPRPPEKYNPKSPWPTERPLILMTSTSHEEGGQRDWSILTKGFEGEDGQVKKLKGVRIQWKDQPEPGKPPFEEIPGSEFEIEADLVLLAMGFTHPEHTISDEIGIELDNRGNFKADYDGPNQYRTSVPKVYAAGDARRGQSLVVWAIHEGREAARVIDLDLMGFTDLPSANEHGYDVAPVEGVRG